MLFFKIILLYFLKEIKFRNYIRDKSSYGKLEKLKSILEYCYSTDNFSFGNKDDIIDFEKLNYTESEAEEDIEDLL